MVDPRAPSPPAAEPERERRSGRDRRQIELGPPHGVERRKSIEARKPQIEEVEMTAEEWEALMAGAPTPTLKPKTDEVADATLEAVARLRN
ncbi:hypothetical protein [Inhella gelatinilytica]|uniref:Uncharacterized protein n=1 Tax=Inhella gelatinilytica TaxID=2795030 RepID=A0A931NA61_9BURK|nr:hypothetical protein [Inhella gelatinilytica]MBH9552123.1 hypothetical protein [Inhella gelatinilytica]